MDQFIRSTLSIKSELERSIAQDLQDVAEASGVSYAIKDLHNRQTGGDESSQRGNWGVVGGGPAH